MINPLRAAISQYYILEYPDDIVWMHYAQEHFYNISGLLTDKIGTGFRPTINVLYYIAYALWGSNETYYYMMNGLLFAGAMVFLYLLIRMLHGRTAGVLAVMLYLFLDASFILVWKMNYTTSIAEIFFITASLYYSIHYFEKGERISLILAVILGILGFFFQGAKHGNHTCCKYHLSVTQEGNWGKEAGDCNCSEHSPIDTSVCYDSAIFA